MSADPTPDISEFAEFADALHGRRTQREQVVRLAIQRADPRYPDVPRGDLTEVLRALEGTLRDLDTAAEELRMQNEALLAARIELEGTAALFQQLFEFAPSPYIVTTVETRIIYANDAACALLQRPKNALAGKPLLCFVPFEERPTFRTALLRSSEGPEVSTWPAVLTPTGAAKAVSCRIRVRGAIAPETRIPRALYWNITEEPDEDLF